MDIEEQVAAASRHYGKFLDDLRERLDALIPHLLWFGRDDTALVTDLDGEQVIRVGPTSAIGADVASLDEPAIARTVQACVDADDFAAQVRFDTINGYYRYRATDERWGGELTVLVRERVDMYVDCPLEQD